MCDSIEASRPKVPMTSKMGNILGNEESGIIILWMRVRSDHPEIRKDTRSLTTSTLNSLDGMQEMVCFSSIVETPLCD